MSQQSCTFYADNNNQCIEHVDESVGGESRTRMSTEDRGLRASPTRFTCANLDTDDEPLPAK